MSVNQVKMLLQKYWRKLIISAVFIFILGVIYAACIEPRQIKITKLSLNKKPVARIVHIGDIHFKGDVAYLRRIVGTINGLSPDIVCFTGDIVENKNYLEDVLRELEKIHAPLYGVPGNHDYWSGVSFESISRSFRRAGGDWLVDDSVIAMNGKLYLSGLSGSDINIKRTASDFAMPGTRNDWPVSDSTPFNSTYLSNNSHVGSSMKIGSPPSNNCKRILLTHYPATVDGIKDNTYDMILSGHSHGGQIRLPFIGALIVPFGVNKYQKGLYSTPAGLLYVTSGLGTYMLPLRFFCRPEIVLIEL